MIRWWWAVLVVAICAGCAPPQSYPLAGRWSVSGSSASAYELEFGPGAAYTERTATSRSAVVTTGTYRVDGNRLVLTPLRKELRDLKTGAVSSVSALPETYGIRWQAPDEATLSAASSTRRMVRAR